MLLEASQSFRKLPGSFWKLPRASGSFPEASGSFPRASGSFPELPEASRKLPEASQELPEASQSFRICVTLCPDFVTLSGSFPGSFRKRWTKSTSRTPRANIASFVVAVSTATPQRTNEERSGSEYQGGERRKGAKFCRRCRVGGRGDVTASRDHRQLPGHHRGRRAAGKSFLQKALFQTRGGGVKLTWTGRTVTGRRLCHCDGDEPAGRWCRR